MPKLEGPAAVAAHLALIAVAITLAFGWVFFLPGCADEPYTWGDGVEEIAEAFCEARVECGWSTHDEVQVCYEGNVENLCERWDCDAEADAIVESKFKVCADDLRKWRCGIFLPASCYEVLEF